MSEIELVNTTAFYIPHGIPLTDIPIYIEEYFVSKEVAMLQFNRLEQRIRMLESKIHGDESLEPIETRRLEVL